VERLRSGDLDAIGPAVRESWEAKRKLASGVTNGEIDFAVSRALDAGAAGAKVTGAGGGGFLLVICPMERQPAVRRSLADMRELPIKLDRLGSRVVLNVMRDIWGCWPLRRPDHLFRIAASRTETTRSCSMDVIWGKSGKLSSSEAIFSATGKAPSA
jgi:hypothetical protein